MSGYFSIDGIRVVLSEQCERCGEEHISTSNEFQLTCVTYIQIYDPRFGRSLTLCKEKCYDDYWLERKIDEMVP